MHGISYLYGLPAGRATGIEKEGNQAPVAWFVHTEYCVIHQCE